MSIEPTDEAVMDVRNWLDTWAPNCGAPRAVFEGQFQVMIEKLLSALPLNGIPADAMTIVRRACR